MLCAMTFGEQGKHAVSSSFLPKYGLEPSGGLPARFQLPPQDSGLGGLPGRFPGSLGDPPRAVSRVLGDPPQGGSRTLE